MAGTVKVNAVQLGDSATASQNFVLQTNQDGSAKLARGNLGATTQDILLIDSAGRVSPAQPVAFFAYRGSNAAIANGTWTKVAIDNEVFDPHNFFDTVNARFLPLVAGYYQINGTVRLSASTAASAFIAQIYKNGSAFSAGSLLNLGGNTTGSANQVTVSDVVYCNGTTDYIELYGYIQGSGTLLFEGGINLTHFSGALVG